MFKCPQCAEAVMVHTDMLNVMDHQPRHCGVPMKRDYRAESVTATFRGGGWARSSK